MGTVAHVCQTDPCIGAALGNQHDGSSRDHHARFDTEPVQPMWRYWQRAQRHLIRPHTPEEHIMETAALSIVLLAALAAGIYVALRRDRSSSATSPTNETTTARGHERGATIGVAPTTTL